MSNFAAAFGRSGGALTLLLALLSCDEPSPAPPEEQRVEDAPDRRVDAGRALAPREDDDGREVPPDSGAPREDAAPATLSPPADKVSTPTDASALAQALPCAVAELLRARCGKCHGTVPQFGAPISLTSWPELHAAARDVPGEKVYQQIAKRVRDDVHPMPPPPAPRLGEAELQTLEAWFAQGAPPSSSAQTCEPAPPSEPPPSSDTPPSDCVDFYELRAHGEAGASDDSPYIVDADVDNEVLCFYFSPPYAEGDQGLWFEPLIDNPQVVHHWLLYGLDLGDRASGSMEPCGIDTNPGKSLIAGWAPGGGPPSLPEDVGMELPTNGLFVELHYYNPTGQEQVDRSGVRICTGPRGTRPHTAAMHFTGTDGICIEPGATSDVSGLCDPPDTEDIHLVNVFPHMHQMGRHMSMTILRKDGSRETLHDGSFDFNAQAFFTVDAVLRPGDQIETRCRHENTTDEQVKWGERTQDEMCYGFVTAWPAGALSTDPSTVDPLTALSLAVQPANRCLNPISFVESCNGVFDLPSLQ